MTVLTAMTAMLFIACAADRDLHPDLAALAEGDYSRVAGSDAAQMVCSAVDRGSADWTSGDINGDGEPELILPDTSGRLSERTQTVADGVVLFGIRHDDGIARRVVLYAGACHPVINSQAR